MPQYRKSSVLYDAHAPPLRGKEAPSPSIVIPTTPDDFFEAAHELHQSGQRRRAIAMLKKISEPLLRKPREQLTREDTRLAMKASVRLMGIAQEDPIGDVEGLQEAVEAAATLVDLRVSPSTLGYLGWAQYLQACECSNPRVRETLCRGSLEAMRHALRLPAQQPLPASSANPTNKTNNDTSQRSASQLVLRAAFVLAYNGFPFDAVEVLESAISTKQRQHDQAEGDVPSPHTHETANMSSELLLLGALHLCLEQTDAATAIFDRLCNDVPTSPHGRFAEVLRVLCVLNYSNGTNRALIDYQVRGLLLKLSSSQSGDGCDDPTEVSAGDPSPSNDSDASGPMRESMECQSTSTLPPHPNNSDTRSRSSIPLPPPLSTSHVVGMLLSAARISALAGSFNTALFAVDAATRIVETEAASATAPSLDDNGSRGGPSVLVMEPSCMSSSPILLKISAAVAAEKGRICTWKANAAASKEDKASLFEAASIQFQAALSLHRYNYEALLGRAAAMRDLGVDMPEAIIEYRKLFGLFPRSVEAVGGLVSCCRAAGQGRVPISDHIEGVPRSSPSSEYVSIPSLAIYASKLSRRHSKGQVVPLEWIMWVL